MTAAKTLVTIAVIQVTCWTQNRRTPQNTDGDDNQPLNANIAMTNENHRGYPYYGHGRR